MLPCSSCEWLSFSYQDNHMLSLIPAGWKDTVFVSANYRTGIFGFLASAELRAHSGDNSSGLYGIHDQTAVLLW